MLKTLRHSIFLPNNLDIWKIFAIFTL